MSIPPSTRTMRKRKADNSQSIPTPTLQRLRSTIHSTIFDSSMEHTRQITTSSVTAVPMEEDEQVILGDINLPLVTSTSSSTNSNPHSRCHLCTESPNSGDCRLCAIRTYANRKLYETQDMYDFIQDKDIFKDFSADDFVELVIKCGNLWLRKPLQQILPVEQAKYVKSTKSLVDAAKIMQSVLHGLKTHKQQTGELDRLSVELNRIVEDCSVHSTKVMFIGDSSAGKSSMINLLIGEDIMVTGDSSTTGTIVILEYGPECSLFVKEVGKVEREVNCDWNDKAAVKQLMVSISTQNATNVYDFVRIKQPNELLKSGLILVDAPGFNDKREYTESVLNEIKDCVSFICVINKFFTDSICNPIQQVLNNRLRPNDPNMLFFVVTHLDDFKRNWKQGSLDGKGDPRIAFQDQKRKHVRTLFNELDRNVPGWIDENIVFLNPRAALRGITDFKACSDETREGLSSLTAYLRTMIRLKLSKNLYVVIDTYQKLFKSVKSVIAAHIAVGEEKVNTIKFVTEAKRRIAEAETDARTVITQICRKEIENWTDSLMLYIRSFKEQLNAEALKIKLSRTEVEPKYREQVNDALSAWFRSQITLILGSKLDSLQTRLVNKVNAMLRLHSLQNEISNVAATVFSGSETNILHRSSSNFSDEIINTYRLNSYAAFVAGGTGGALFANAATNSVLDTATFGATLLGGPVAGLVATVATSICTAYAAQYAAEYAIKWKTDQILENEASECKYKRELAHEFYSYLNKHATKIIRDNISDRYKPEDMSSAVIEWYRSKLKEIEEQAEINRRLKASDEEKKQFEKYYASLERVAKILLTENEWPLRSEQVIFDKRKDKVEGTKSTFKGKYFSNLECGRSKTVAVNVVKLSNLSICTAVYHDIMIQRPIDDTNIISTYGAYINSSKTAVHLVTEWASEGNLRRYLSANISLADSNKIDIIQQILRGLRVFHSFGMYGTLSTQSIFVHRTSDGSPIAKLYQKFNAKKLLNPSFVAPEVLRNHTSDVASDVYSLGMIIWCLIYPEKILEDEFASICADEGIQDIAQAIKSGRRPRISTEPGNQLHEVTRLCWNEKPNLRPSIDQIMSRILHTSPSHSLSHSHRPLRILAIDGGGGRGIIPATVLEHFLSSQSEHQSTFSEMFDLVCGTSTGGLIVLGLCSGALAVNDIPTVYKQLGLELFGEGRFASVSRRTTSGLTAAEGIHANVWYDAERLERTLKAWFRERSNELLINVVRPPRFFVTCRRGEDPGPFLLRNYVNAAPPYHGRHDFTLVEAARATSAAQTYLSPLHKDGVHYADGGLGYNNPTELAYYEALSICETSDISNAIACIVSIGCGDMPPIPRKSFWLNSQLALDAAVEQATNSADVHQRLELITRRHKIPYYRFDPTLVRRYDLSVHGQQMLELQRITMQYLETKEIKERTKDMLAKLTSPR